MAVRSCSLDTLAIHAAQEPDPSHAAVMQPIVLSSTFAQAEPGKPKRFEYSRSGNPTREALEAPRRPRRRPAWVRLRERQRRHADALAHAVPGDHVVCGDDVYGGTFRLFDKVMKPMNITTTFVDMRDPSRVSAAIGDKTRLVWLETPTNPLLKLFDIEKVAAIAKARSLPLVVDNTFASPVLQRPLELGATVVMHSTTKYINGHSDVVGGALVTSDDALGERIAFLQNAIGAVPSPMDCYLVLRGLKTLPVRMRQHVKSASELARRLTEEKQVRVVHYPGLASHPDHALCQKQMAAGGGMISLELEGGVDESRRFLSALRVFTLAESLGGVESLAEHPAIMTHASIPPEVRRAVGISDSLVRLSVGLEDVEDLWNDLKTGLEAMR
ncbi:MAG: PLP-dependent aspartate aminotransferase family protein [Polyangiaceae bacterium]